MQGDLEVLLAGPERLLGGLAAQRDAPDEDEQQEEPRRRHDDHHQQPGERFALFPRGVSLISLEQL